MLFQPPQVQQDSAGRDACGHFPDDGLQCVTWNTGGLVGSVLSSQRNRELKLNFFGKLIENNNVICLQEVHGKNEFLQAVQVWAPRFRLFGTFIPDNENAGRSVVCIHEDPPPEDAIVTHVIARQGPDHILNVLSGRKNLVIVNVHIEPELTLRHLRERLHFTTPHWPPYPNAVTSIFVSQKKECSKCGTKPSPTATRERPPCFILFFHMSSRLLNLSECRTSNELSVCHKLLKFVPNTSISRRFESRLLTILQPFPTLHS